MRPSEWNLGRETGLIISLEDFAKRRGALDYVSMTSGGFDPIHPGHLTTIIDAANAIRPNRFASCTVVVVNDDAFLENKKGAAFMDVKTRCQVVSCIRGVDYVIPFGSKDGTVIEAIKAIRPTLFVKGGDRCDRESIPEWDVCKALNVSVRTGAGEDKHWSSSELLDRWRGIQ